MFNCVGQFDTGAGVTGETSNWAKMLKRARIYDAEGDRLNLTGPELRAFNCLERGVFANVTSQPTDIAASASNQSKTIDLVYDCAPWRARRRWDYAIPADTLLKGGGIEIETPSPADMGLTGGDPTIDSLAYVVYVYCRENMDPNPEVHTRREIRSITTTSRTEFSVPVHGGLLRTLFLYKAADDDEGGADLSSITDVTCDTLGYTSIPVRQLNAQLTLEGPHSLAGAGDPFQAATVNAIAIVAPRRDMKIPEMPSHPGMMFVRMAGGTVDSISIVYEVLTGRTRRSNASEVDLVSQPGVTGVEVKVKTAGKSRKEPGQWVNRGRDLSKYLPAKLKVSRT